MKFWLTTDKDGYKHIHTAEPIRCENNWLGNKNGDSILVDEDCFESDSKFSNLTWEDEPIKIEVLWINSMECKTKQNKV